jgi:hypothetical protein
MKNRTESIIECIATDCRHNLYTECNLKMLVINKGGVCEDYTPPKTSDSREFILELHNERKRGHK